jgi:hypothetical protein
VVLKWCSQIHRTPHQVKVSPWFSARTQTGAFQHSYRKSDVVCVARFQIAWPLECSHSSVLDQPVGCNVDVRETARSYLDASETWISLSLTCLLAATPMGTCCAAPKCQLTFLLTGRRATQLLHSKPECETLLMPLVVVRRLPTVVASCQLV